MNSKSIFRSIIFYIAFAILFLFQTHSNCQVNLVDDGSFEGGPSGVNWFAFSLFGDPICDIATCGSLGAGPHSGSHFVRLQADSVIQPLPFFQSYVYQSVHIPVGNFAQLTFYIEQFQCGNPDDSIIINIDFEDVFVIPGNGPLCGIAGYSFQAFDMSAYADGTSHTIQFILRTYPQTLPQRTVVHIDDVSLVMGSLPNTNVIAGKLFMDSNTNGILDPGETPLAHKEVVETTTGLTSYSNSLGNYFFLMPTIGSFNIQSPSVNYYTASPSSIPVSFLSLGILDSNNHIGFQPSTIVDDLSISIAPASPFRPGMNASYSINYFNFGTTALSPVITFYPDDNVVFQSSNLTPSLVTPDSIQWVPAQLSPYESGQISVLVNVDSSVAINTMINSTVKIEPLLSDFNPSNNLNGWELLTTGSLDPNDILVSRSTLLTTEFPNPPFLDYIIRFQNTGNDTAFTVRIDNHLTEDLNYNSFEFIGSSHPVELVYNPVTRYLQFIFNNILLPDSNINETESHGFVHYRIKPVSSLNIGDNVLNYAGIYFDFNQAVATNVASTEVVLPVGISQQSAVSGQRLLVYPNPFRDEINVVIEGMDGNNISVKLYDVYGRMVDQLYSGIVNRDKHRPEFIDGLKVTSNLNAYSKGIYFVRIESEEGAQNLKIVKY